MPDQVNTDVERIAIIFGAGASCSEGAPKQSDLFRSYFSSANRKAAYSPTLEIDRELATFFAELFGIDVDDGFTRDFPTFEEVLGVLELADLREEGFKGFDVSGFCKEGASRIRSLRSYLVLLIAAALDEALRQEGKYHNELMYTIMRCCDISLCDFISLNYDILLDNALIRLKESTNVDLDYGIEFSNFARPGQWSRPDPNHKLNLFKLHGSLNWLFCSVCGSMTLTPKEKGVCNLIVNPGLCVCPECRSMSVPIIIPPTYFKVLSNLYLQEVWRGAEKAMAAASTWIVCGYSFPDADIHVKYLMKRAEVNKPRPRRVFVCNGDRAKDSAAAKAEEQRFKRFFGSLTEVTYSKLSFEQFVADPNQILRRA